MKRLALLAVAALSLAAAPLVSDAQTSTNATPTGNFFNTVEGYFTSFNTDLDSTFGAERADIFTGVDSIQGGSVALANSLGVSYDVLRFANKANTNLFSTALAIESVTRNSGIAGTLVSEQVGVGLSFIIHDVKLTGYLDGGYDFARQPDAIGQTLKTGDRLYGEIGLRAFKALTTHTYGGVGVGAQVPRNCQVFSAFVGFNF